MNYSRLVHRRFTMTCGLLLVACAGAGDPDPLDPAVIADISQSQGSASGSAWSGIYVATTTNTTCDCPPVELLDGTELDLCALLAAGDEIELEVTQADGFLSVRADLVQLTGPIDADDGFVVAGTFDFAEPTFEIEVHARLDGEFELVDGAAQMIGLLRHRPLGTVLDEPLDCRVEQDVVGIR
jgi:hypothetical protein